MNLIEIINRAFSFMQPDGRKSFPLIRNCAEDRWCVVEVESHPSRAESIPRHIEETLQERDGVRLCVGICGDLIGRSQAMRFIALFFQRVDASSSGYSRSSFQCALADKDFRRESKAWRGTKLHAIGSEFRRL
jgi:hypothetical protein